MTWQETQNFLWHCMPPQVVKQLKLLREGELREIRVRSGGSIVLYTARSEIICPGKLEQKHVEQIAEALSEHALYARAEEQRSGYVTLRGGHRMGICGRVICQGQNVRALREISSLCVRIAGQWRGAASQLMPWLVDQNGRCLSTLIVGIPGSGKTTMLREAIRCLSEGGLKMGVVDERSEIAAMCEGTPQLDIGPNTDVLDGCRKDAGLRWLLRGMTPDAIATDELRDAQDGEAVLEAVKSGVSVLATAHGRRLDTALERGTLRQLSQNRAFSRYVLLQEGDAGQIAGVYSETLQPLVQGEINQ